MTTKAKAAPKRKVANSKRLPDGPDWTFELIERYHQEIRRVAELYRLDTYPNQIEIITSEQMMDAYSSIGMPINYNHWSFGKKFIQTEQTYKHGQMGLAYEIVINSDPCIAYLMEENTVTMQALVMAHACLRPQLLLQRQLSIPNLDRCQLDHRLPAVCQKLHC